MRKEETSTGLPGNFKAITPPDIAPKKEKRLTSFAHGGGCGCKIAPADLEQLLSKVPKTAVHPDLLVGIEHSDDAAVFKINDKEALVFTNDFFTPTIDDPYIFGRVASANALSDVYAMGGTPILANAIAGFPVNEIPSETLQEIMHGGVDVCREAGIPLSGGHSIDNPQPIFGLACVGRIDIHNIKSNAGARMGDSLILTKSLGIGVLASAYRIDRLDEHGYDDFVGLITQINTPGRWLGARPDVHALTDITGFGLAGHLVEMAEGSGATMHIAAGDIPIAPSARPLGMEGMFPGGAYRNMDAYTDKLSFGDDWDVDTQLFYSDPQTNGGLLIAVEPAACDEIIAQLQAEGFEDATVIGSVGPALESGTRVVFDH